MSIATALTRELQMVEKHFTTTLSAFGDDDAGYAPGPELYTVAGHVAHVADTVDWFVEGAFRDGWDMDFEALIARAKAVTSLPEAREWMVRAFASCCDAVAAASDDELRGPIPDARIMDGAPRLAIVSAITDHTAHHRGALAVYARLLGKEPPMPYA